MKYSRACRVVTVEICIGRILLKGVVENVDKFPGLQVPLKI
jgi:hypothetical protein